MLNEKQRRFAEEYLIDLNATQAAIRAGYSTKTADRQGHRLLKNAEIQAAVTEGQRRRLRRVEVNQDTVLRELLRIATADIRNLFHPDGRLKKPEELDDDTAAAIASIEVVVRPVAGSDGEEVEHVAKLKAWDKPRALEMLGRHLALFKDAIDLNVTGGLGERLAKARARRQAAAGADGDGNDAA
jgi:phage terminase small subunit